MVTVHPSVTSERIAQGRHSPFLGDVTVGRPCPRHSPQQRCGPSTRVWGYHNATTPSLISCAVLGIGVSCQSPRSWLCLPRAPSGFCGCGTHLQAHTGRGFVSSHPAPPWEATGQSPTGSPHTSALLASPLGSPGSSHGGSKAALVSLTGIFSHLSPLDRGHKGDPLCSAPIRPHPGTASCLVSQTGEKLDTSEGLKRDYRDSGTGALAL